MLARPPEPDQPDVTTEGLLPQPLAHPLAAWVSARWRTLLLRVTSPKMTRNGAGAGIILHLVVKFACVVMTTDVPHVVSMEITYMDTSR
jgi:hypothetical protein